MFIVKIGRTVEKLCERGVLMKIAPLLHWNEILRNLTSSFCSPCFPESIGVLIAKIGRAVEKLFIVRVFDKKCSLARLE
jgi:hypothetical protein